MTDSINSLNPILIAVTKETRPEQITLHGLTGGRFKNVRLPKRLASLDEVRKQTVLRWCVKNYLKRFKGSCPFWGKVIGFQYHDCNSHYEINLDATTFNKLKDFKKINVELAYVCL